MEIFIVISGLPLLFIGYKIGVGKFLNRTRWYQSFLFWYFRLASLSGMSIGVQQGKYLVGIIFFLVAGFMWANLLDKLYKKIINIKDGVVEPFKPKTKDEINDEKIANLENEIKNTRKDINTQNRIKELELELKNLKNPPPPEPENIAVEVEPEPIPEPPKDPIVEANKKELKSVLNKLGF